MTPKHIYTVELRSLELEGTESVGKHLKSVGGGRLKKSVDYRVNR
jgi:hypothetical protein